MLAFGIQSAIVWALVCGAVVYLGREAWRSIRRRPGACCGHGCAHPSEATQVGRGNNFIPAADLDNQARRHRKQRPDPAREDAAEDLPS